MRKLVIIFTIFIFYSCTYANNIKGEILQEGFKVTIPWLKQKPKSYAKDFFIVQFLNQQDTSYEQAQEAYSMVKRKNSHISKAYKKFRNISAYSKKCYNATIDELLLMNDEKCIALGLSLKEAKNLSFEQLQTFINKLSYYTTLKKDLKILQYKDMANEDLKYGYKTFYKFFFSLGSDFREKYYDQNYSENFINKLAKNKQFEMLIRYTIYNKNSLQNLQKALLKVNDNKNLTTNALFLLGINAVNYKDENKAFEFFQNAYKKAYLKTDKDRALFWTFLVTQNSSFLFELAQSWSTNLYSVYAKELTNLPLSDIFYELDIPQTPSDFDVYNQFAWMKVLSDTKKMNDSKLNKYKNLFTSEDTTPHLAFVLQRYYKYKRHYFLTPYKNITKDIPLDRKIMLYSIARQESRFIPSSISVSTAQGVMQIMPFLSKDIAERLGENYNIYEQFDPQKNIQYGSFHIKSLMKRFDNDPLFIAYAYNGGAGYTSKQLKKGLFSRKEFNRYEPFLSMEMISYPETKEYGKKVLTNYYIYNNYLNPENKIRLSTIFKNLKSPY